ncbi:taste receptor type 2 member 40-like [Rana temporaria]|uniref:taste receptor type 2 member 40-like n=1 Tax=Rana temporaria TaxID=8407 RepID=UPI001AAD4152|nr:taste receptor type 2 member 40-like [Rana temporaria]
MPSAVQILLITVGVLQLGVGTSLNSCILVFSFKNLKNRLSVNPTNLIYSVKGLVNIFLLLVLTTENVATILWPNVLLNRELHLTMTFLMLSPIYYNYWLTGWLCAHYCLSISNFTHKLLVGFKRFLSSFLPRVLLLSAIISFVMSVLSIWEIHISQEPPSTNSTQDAPSISVVYFIPKACRLVATILGCCLPLNLALVSIRVTTSSLIRHMTKMKQNFSGNKGPNLQVLINTTRTMTLFLALSVISYIICFVFLSGTSSYDTMIISFLPIMTFPLIEAVIIIQAVPKLRNMVVGKVCAGTRWSTEIENRT